MNTVLCCDLCTGERASDRNTSGSHPYAAYFSVRVWLSPRQQLAECSATWEMLCSSITAESRHSHQTEPTFTSSWRGAIHWHQIATLRGLCPVCVLRNSLSRRQLSMFAALTLWQSYMPGCSVAWRKMCTYQHMMASSPWWPCIMRTCLMTDRKWQWQSLKNLILSFAWWCRPLRLVWGLRSLTSTK